MPIYSEPPEPKKPAMDGLNERIEKLSELLEQATDWAEHNKPNQKHPLPIKTGIKEFGKLAILFGVQTVGLVAWGMHQWDGHDARITAVERQNAQEDAALERLLDSAGKTTETLARIDEHVKGVDARVERIENRATGKSPSP
jgi:hypothetical protein